MKKIIYPVIVCSIIILNLAQISYAQDYYCKWQSGFSYKSKEVTYGQSAYEFCAPEQADEILFSKCVVEDYPESVQAIKNGDCREIIKKELKIGNSTCTIKLLKPNNEFYSRSCDGPDKDSALIQLDNKLRQQNIIVK